MALNSSLPPISSEQDSLQAALTRTSVAVRSCLNRIVTVCELLKSEVLKMNRPHLTKSFEHAAMGAAMLTRDLENLLAYQERNSPMAILPDWHARIVEVGLQLSSMLERLRTELGETGNMQVVEDLLQLNLAAHDLLKTAGQAGLQALIPIASSAEGGGESLVPAIQRTIEDPSAHHPALPDRLKYTVLIADDDDTSRELIGRLLRPEPERIFYAAEGGEVLAHVDRFPVDLILLDVLMPGMDGFETLRKLKQNKRTQDIPVVMISGVDDIENVAACIEIGAEDYLLKPFNKVLLRSRVRALLDRRQLRDRERASLQELRTALSDLEAQKAAAEDLLLNILPYKTAQELKATGAVVPSYFEDITMVFTDFVSFTASTEKMSAEDLVTALNEYFTEFDLIVEGYRLEKLKTVGDSYIFVAGVPGRTSSHPVDAILAAFEMLRFVKRKQACLPGWAMRVGINTGPAIAGVVGKRKFAFDVWGESMNLGSRMVMSGAPDRINISARTYERVKDFFATTSRGHVEIKGNRKAEMYFVDGFLPSLIGRDSLWPPKAFRERYIKYFDREPLEFTRGTAGD